MAALRQDYMRLQSEEMENRSRESSDLAHSMFLRAITSIIPTEKRGEKKEKHHSDREKNEKMMILIEFLALCAFLIARLRMISVSHSLNQDDQH